MDLRHLLGKLDLIEGSMAKAEKHPTGPKFTGQWKGTDKGTPGRKLVGDSVEPDESILKDLAKGPTPKTKEQELAEQFEQFLSQLEEENLGVADKRPARKGSRPQRDMGKTGEPSKRYKTIKESVDDLLTKFREGWRGIEQSDAYHPETKKVMKHFCDSMRRSLMREDMDQFWWTYNHFSSNYPDAFVNFFDDCGLHSIDDVKSLLTLEETKRDPHKVITQKLQNVERERNPQPAVDDREARKARAREEYRQHVAKMKKQNPDYVPLYKVDEAGANNPPQGATTQQMQQAKNVAQGTQALKAATGSSAPTDVLAKAIDTASQGTTIDAKSAQALEPTMDIIKQVAQDPNLANQFKSFATQAKTSAARQLNQQRKP